MSEGGGGAVLCQKSIRKRDIENFLNRGILPDPAESRGIREKNFVITVDSASSAGAKMAATPRPSYRASALNLKPGSSQKGQGLAV